MKIEKKEGKKILNIYEIEKNINEDIKVENKIKINLKDKYRKRKLEMIELLNNKRLIHHKINMNDKIMFKRNYQFRQNVLEISKYKKIGNYNTYIENNKIIKINNNNNNKNI